MNKKQSILKVDSILEYYDNPQLLTARDCFDTLYLCLLYQDTSSKWREFHPPFSRNRA